MLPSRFRTCSAQSCNITIKENVIQWLLTANPRIAFSCCQVFRNENSIMHFVVLVCYCRLCFRMPGELLPVARHAASILATPFFSDTSFLTFPIALQILLLPSNKPQRQCPWRQIICWIGIIFGFTVLGIGIAILVVALTFTVQVSQLV